MKKLLVAVTAFVLLGFSVACEEGGDDADRSLDEHACDEAAAVLARCCPGVTAESIACRVEKSPGGCDHRQTSYSVLIPLHDADECILHSSCIKLEKDGVCEALRTAVRGSYSTSSGDPPSDTSPVSVCPSLRGGGVASSSSSGGTTPNAPSTPALPPSTGEGTSDTSSCSGWATSCSELDVASCASQAGCAVAGDECIGAPSPCSFQSTENACARQAGCTWGP